MKSFNTENHNNDIEDGPSNFLNLTESGTQGFLGDHLIADREGPSENPDFHNVSIFLDENPMKKDGPTISDRRPSVVSADSSEQLSFFQRLMRSMGLAPSPLDIARREKYREMLEEMRATGPLKGNRAIDTAVANPKFLKMLEKYDINGDGVIDAEELTVMLNDFHSQKQQSSVLKKVVAGAFLFLIALLICNTLLTFLVIKLTQEVYVDNDTTSMVNSNNEILKTDKPRFYTSISDLTRLPAAALDSITRMTFTTIDGGVYNLLVNGVRLDATANSSVDVYFSSNKRMHIQGNNTAVFMDYDTADGTPTEVAVVLNTNDPLSTLSQSTSRRLSEVEARLGYSGVGTMSSKAGSDRCFSSGVCLYTYEEMISLFDEHGRRLQTASSSSSPSASTMTYTEISADAKILTKDDRAGLSRAQGFLAALLQEEANIKNGTLKVSFIMSDLCANYPTLRDDCRSYPAPQVVYPVNSSNLQDRRPFYGTTAEDGLWMFQDEIEYLLDAYSVQVKVRYAHDPLRDSRRHVVLMSLTDMSKFVTYDEVTIQFDPLNPTFPIQSARTYVTNYNSSSSMIPDGTNTFLNGNVSVNTGGRRLMAHNAFLDHVRSKISGFPIIHIPEEVLATPVLGSNKNDEILHLNEVNRRLNAVGSSRNISVDAEMSPDGYCVSTVTDVNGNYLPCLSNNGTGVSITYPKSYFSNVWIGTLSGSIAWPNSSSIYSIEPYETTQIVYRSDLKHLLDLQTSNKSASRRLHTFTDEHQEKRIALHLTKKEELREQTQAHFAALDQALGEMLKKHEQRRRLSEMRETVQHRRLDSDAVDTFQQDAATTHTVVNNFGSSLISNDQKEEIRKKLSSALGNEVNSFFTQIVNSALSSVPMRHGSTCTQFHGLMGQMLQDIADLNDVIVKAIQYSSNIDQSLDDIKELQSMLGDLVSINNLMKPIMPAIGSIPYVGSVAKVFQNAFNTLVTDPVTPAKKYVDDIQSELTQWKIKVYNDKFLIVAENISTSINNFVFDATTFGDVLVAVDDSCLWTPTTVKGVVTYNYTLTGQTCSEINVVLLQALSDIDLIKSQVNLFLGRIQQVSNLVNIATIFIKTFDASLISTIQSVFSVIGSFLNRQISACIPWICFTSRQVCSTVSYPCGVKRCRTRFGHIPCGIKFCSDNECVSVPEPYDCPQCASFTVQEIINGVMAVASQLQQIIMNALNSLAQALGISFPMVSIPGLPSVNFMSGIESFLSNLFDDVLDATMLNTLTKDLNNILSKFNLNSLVCNK